MHDQVREWVQASLLRVPAPYAVVDLGGRNVNGSLRDLVPEGSYVAVDSAEGDGVDVVGDARTWQPVVPVDVVLCTEVLEHTPHSDAIIANAWRMLKPGGVLILTAATVGRGPHGMSGAPNPAEGEWYRNVEHDELAGWLERFERFEIDVPVSGPADIRAIAWR